MGAVSIPESLRSKASLVDDVRQMQTLFDGEVARMTGAGERFDHAIPLIGGIIGNSMYKYLNEDSVLAAPVGPLFDRLYGSENYKNIKECYDQAETILRVVDRHKNGFATKWKLGMVTHPGHYWACAQGSGAFVHMDAWVKKFWVSTEIGGGSLRSVSWQDWHG
jgi:hypothetical protein